MTSTLRVHSYMIGSRANGPGRRAVVWTQGCSIGCRGCFNPMTHDAGMGSSYRPIELAEVLAVPGNDGLTITGGEPLDQWDAVCALLSAWRARSEGTVILMSGIPFSRIRSLRSQAEFDELTSHLDVLIAGPYVQALRDPGAMKGSSNKTTHLFSDRIRIEELDATPTGEVLISADGTLTLSGVLPLQSMVGHG